MHEHNLSLQRVRDAAREMKVRQNLLLMLMAQGVHIDVVPARAYSESQSAGAVSAMGMEQWGCVS